MKLRDEAMSFVDAQVRGVSPDLLQQALSLSQLSKHGLPPRPAILRIEVQDYLDFEEDAGLRVLVVIPDETNLDSLSGQDVGDLKRAIHESLLEQGITLFPYIHLAMPGELAEVDEEEV